MPSDVLILSSANLELQLSPSMGGAISQLAYRSGGTSRSVLRESRTPIENVLEAGNFPLVPFVNRIRGGSFVFRGQGVSLSTNMAGDPSPLHGQGWLGRWDVEQSDSSSARLSYRHQAGEWPWTYQALQEFRVEESAVSIGLTCRNLSNEPMPCGLGQHPYFPCTPCTRIDTDVSFAWTIDERVLPVAKVPATGLYDLSDRPICGQGLDNGFEGWSGRVLMSDPGWPYELELSSPQARFFQIYSPARGGFFVAEPVTHANAALNAPEAEWAELGLRILEPGEGMRLDMRLEVRSK
jgi:aldose 1-epimerase